MSSSPSIPSVKSVKKSAFSCDACRRRKVKCGGERPTCHRCVKRNETCLYKLSPTLSYTQQLEAKVKELEAVVSQLQRTPAVSALHGPPLPFQDASSPHEATVPELAGTFEGLKVDDRGAITWHGVTSFFQLPTPG